MEGKRKFWFSVVLVVCVAAVVITVVIVQPPGLNLETVFGGGGLLSLIVSMLFKGTNIMEHAIDGKGAPEKDHLEP